MLKKLFLEPVEKIVLLAVTCLTVLTIFISIYFSNELLIVISVLLTVFLLAFQKTIMSESWYFMKADLHEKVVIKADQWSRSVKALTFRLLSDKRNKYYWLSYFKLNSVPVIAASDPSSIRSRDYIPDEFMIVSGQASGFEKSDFKIHVGSSQCMQPFIMDVLHFKHPYSSFIAGKEFDAASVSEQAGKDIVLEINKSCPFMTGRSFDEKLFLEVAMKPEVRMIEVDFSSMTGWLGEEMRIEGITDLLSFIWTIRRITVGKPVGIKLTKYNRGCLSSLCSTINKSLIIPDFITLSEAFYTSFQAHPANEGKCKDDFFANASMVLRMHKLDEEVKLIAEGPVKSGYELYKSFALGISAWFLNSKTRSVALKTQRFFSEVPATSEELLKSCFEFMKLGGYTETWQIEPYSIYKKDAKGRYGSLNDLYFQKTGGFSSALIKHYNLN